jgi:hypothetical membrane protein
MTRNAVAAILLMLAGSTVLMGIITAEALFPGPFNTGDQTVSTLASRFQPGDEVREPSATIFNLTLIASGLMLGAAAYLLRGYGRALPAALGLLGAGCVLVGFFPGEIVDGVPSTEGVHPLVAMLAFLSGASGALLTARVTTAPFRWFSLAIGLICLVALFGSSPLADTSLGEGGVERWIVYPVVIWLVALGGYVLGRPEPLDRAARLRGETASD